MPTSNTRIKNFKKLISPREVRAMIPFPENSEETIVGAREELYKILNHEDDRFIVIAGPCSIHDKEIALEYARRLNVLREKYREKLFIIMRIYFEKPRTIDGWKGWIYDPDINNTYDIEEGIKRSRDLLLKVTAMGLPVATEILDPIIAAYIGQLASWVAIGARTTESQTHRQMSSGLSAPVGFKNSTDGNIEVAVNAIRTAMNSHNFIGIDDEGNSSVIQTSGNPYGHIVLRGGGGKPNYHIEDIEECEKKLAALNLPMRIIVDCSHDNSGKNHKRQKLVVRDVLLQKQDGNQSIRGIMLESNLFEGKQSIPADLTQLKYGVSITDACVGWKETEKLLHSLYTGLP